MVPGVPYNQINFQTVLCGPE